MAAHSPSVRPSAVAGQFYPAEAKELKAQVEDLLARAPDVEVEGQIVGLVVPHAGYPYSGQTAADAYRQLRGGDYDAAVVLAPSHRGACDGTTVFPGDGYETPMGVVPVHRTLTQSIADRSDLISPSQDGHRVSGDPLSELEGEHAIEVQLPFLQVVLPGVPIVPAVMGDHSLETCRDVAGAIASACRDLKVLIVASSDLYHGHDHGACVASDRRTLDQIVAMSPEQLWEGVRAGRLQACGSGPILTLLMAVQQMGATDAHLVSRTTSADVVEAPGGYVVGYGAVLFLCNRRALEPEGALDEQAQARLGCIAPEGTLDEQARAALGRIARDAVRAAARGEQPQAANFGNTALRQSGRAFVTLYADGRLRGCIGDLQGADPLGLVVQRMAAAATTRDPRFPPLTPDELSGLQIEISVIGPFRSVREQEDIQIGRDGLWLRLGPHQGVLLPKVAVESAWTPAEFLSHTCRKAQLPSNAWQDPDAEIQTFPADVFTA